MYHVLAYAANVFGVTDNDTPAITDGIMTIQNSHFLPDKPWSLYGGWFSGVNLTRTKIRTPRIRQVADLVVTPLQATLLPGDRPHIFDRRKTPLTLAALEEIQILQTVGGAANAFNWAILFIGTSFDPPPQGDVYGLHGTSTTAATANAWSQITVAWDTNLPAGRYAVIGSQVQSTNGIAHRFIFKDQVMRPGFLSTAAITNIGEPSYYYGGWGKLGEFNTYTLPNVEVLANGADAAHDVILNVVRIG